MDYAEIAADAALAIREAGREIRLIRPSVPGTHDPVSGFTSGAGAPVEIPTAAVVLPSMQLWPSGRSVDAVAPSDRFAMVCAEEGIVPLRTDRVKIGTETYSVVDMEELAPAGTPVLYTLHLRI